MMRRRVGLVALAIPLIAGPVAAQGRRGPPGALQGAGGAPEGQRRLQLEQQLRRGLWRIAKERVGLTDDQMSKLEATSARFDERRRALVLDERAQRMTLRTEILADAKADQNRIAAALDRLLQLQRQRIDLQAEEQREFAGFMTPLQRARYAALQEQVRRRIEMLRRQRGDSAGVRSGR
jgi:hypothetical protein